MPNGRGTYYDDDGNLYEGGWVSGRRAGQGKMMYGPAAEGELGDVYEGQWQDDTRHGKGTMTYRSGNVYEGHWAADARHGRGTLFYVDKGMRFDGEWAKDGPRAGVYAAMETLPPGAPGALPVLELDDAKGVLQAAMRG